MKYVIYRYVMKKLCRHLTKYLRHKEYRGTRHPATMLFELAVDIDMALLKLCVTKEEYQDEDGTTDPRYGSAE